MTSTNPRSWIGLPKSCLQRTIYRKLSIEHPMNSDIFLDFKSSDFVGGKEIKNNTTTNGPEWICRGDEGCHSDLNVSIPRVDMNQKVLPSDLIRTTY